MKATEAAVVEGSAAIPKFADLHLHTHFSDGTFTPEELVDAAAKQELSAIALSDHDTMAGCPRAQLAATRLGIEFIPACELTADHSDKEIHLLGYGLDPTYPPMSKFLSRCRETRRDRVREIANRLGQHGAPLPGEVVDAMTQMESPGRPHLGQALVDAGHCNSMDEAFARFLKKGKPGWAPKWRIPSGEALNLIHEAGGIAVLAHPALYRLDSAIEELAALGLDGLECFHSKHSANAAHFYTDQARQFGLIATGGSDCHGMTKGTPLIGQVKLDWERYEIFRTRMLESKSRPASH